MRRWIGLVIVITLAGGCKRSAPPAPAREVQASALPKIVVKQRDKLLFTYATASGGFESVSELSKVPEGRRGWVRVVDLTIQPQHRQDHELVYVADLRAPGKDGCYPYVVLSRAAFEAAAVARAAQGATDPAPARAPATPPAGGGKVILYSTSWCPACRTARDYLTSKGIPFEEKDIEKDSAASAELLAKAKAAGISASGVPVLDVNGTLMQGFDADRLTALLGERT